MKNPSPPFQRGQLIRAEFHPAIRIISEADCVCEYVASDETLDYYGSIIRADGWQFNRFAKNAPFVDSHDYDSIRSCLGEVTDFRVAGRQLIERVRWAAKDFPGTLAEWGWKMTVGGFLKAVSVGFEPLAVVSRYGDNKKEFEEQVKDLGLTPEQAAALNYVCTEQDQMELSACVIGANPNAVARAYRAGCLNDEDIDKLSQKIAAADVAQLSRKIAQVKTATPTANRADVEAARQRAQTAFLLEFQRHL